MMQALRPTVSYLRGSSLVVRNFATAAQATTEARRTKKATAPKAAAAPKTAAATDTPDSDKPLRTKDVAAVVAKRLNIDTKDVADILDEALTCIQDTVAAGGKVQFTGFGVFKRTETAARAGRNPKTGEAISLQDSARPAFVAGKSFKDHVKQAYTKK